MKLIETLPDGMTIALSESADEASRNIIHEGVKSYNNAVNEDFRIARDPAHGPQPLDVYLRTAEGDIIGGLTANTIWHWLRIGDLWLENDQRGKGYGSRLVQIAVDAARTRGCTSAELKTFSFQARGFYEKLGFVVTGKLEDFPPGHTFYWMRKDF